MKPLSFFKFLKGSFGKVLPLAITGMLAVGLFYFAVIVNSYMNADKNEMHLSWLKKASFVTDNDPTMKMLRKGNGIAPADAEALRSLAEVKDLFGATLWSVNYQTISDNASLFLVMLDAGNVAPVMRDDQLTLAEGTMPANPGEIVLQRLLAANFGLKVGSVVSQNTPGWHIGMDLKVVGIANGPALIGIGEIHPSCAAIGNPGVGLVAFPNGASLKSMNQFIVSDLGRKYSVFTLGMAEPDVDKVAQSNDFIVILIGAILVIALGVLLENITMIQYAQRAKEFELMHAVGYTKRAIAGKILRELGASNLIGYAAGIGAGVLGGWLMNVYLLEDTYRHMPLVNFGAMQCLLLVPLFITAIGMLAPRKLQRFQEIF